MSEESKKGSMESLINGYIRRELVNKPDFQLKNDAPLFESKVLDSRSLLKLVMFVEKEFRVAVGPEELFPENFETVDRICSFLRAKQEKKE